MAAENGTVLTGAEIVIVGGSSGMGLALARRCQAAGARITIVSRSEEKLKRAAAELGDTVAILAADVTDAEAIGRLFASLDQVDHLYSSAGRWFPGTILGSDLELLRPAIDHYIWGPINLVKHAAPKMSAGSITFTSGQVSMRPSRDAPMMSVSLVGLEMLVKTLALELAPVRVNAVAPGVIDTPLLGKDREDVARYSASLPVGRLGQADEVAQAVTLMMTNSLITGHVLRIDGGTSLR